MRFNFKKVARYTFITVAGLTIVGTIAVGGYSYHVIRNTPKVTKQKFESQSTTRIYDANNKLIYRPNMQYRDYVKYKDIPKQYQDALISTEDRTFWKNPGFDIMTTGKATVKQLLGRADAGGSTITQQLVKLSVYGTDQKYRTIDRKIQEIWLSFQVSQIFSKQQILEMYVNKMFMGENVYGAQTISELYYGKKLSDLDLSQTAIIAGIGQSPSYYDLYTNPDAVSKRRGDVLAAMVNNKKISEQQAEDAMKEPVKTGLRPRGSFTKTRSSISVNKDYIQSVMNQLKAEGYDPYTQKLTVHTNLKQDVQDKLYKTLNDSPHYNLLRKKDIQAAGTVVNPNTGGVVAEVGGRGKSQDFGLNRATSGNRSTGSSTKPLIDYGPAIERFGWGTDHTIVDDKYTYPGTNIQLYDWDRLYPGAMTMKYALQQSRNVPAVKTLDQVGGQYSQSFLKKLGINVKKVPGGADAIGMDIPVSDVASAYGDIANGGKHHKQSYIKDVVIDGEKEQIQDDKGKQVIKQSTAYMLTNMMESTFARNATTYEAKIDGLVQAGKSGLVGYDGKLNVPDKAISDAWMVGFTKPDKKTGDGYSLAIWNGYDNPNQPGSYIDYANQRLPELLYKDVMKDISKGQKNGQWSLPDDVKQTSGGSPESVNTHYAPTDMSMLPSPATTTDVMNADKLQKYFEGGKD